VSDYRLKDRGSIPGSGEGFFRLASVSRLASKTHPVSCSVGTEVLSAGVKRCRGVKLATHPSSAEVKNE
jgi:hypothetical protein